MQFTTEITAGAISICLTIIGMGMSGIGAVIGIYFKTRTDIMKLQTSHASLETGQAEIKGAQAVMVERMNKQDQQLDRIASRIELLSAIEKVPNDMAAALGKLFYLQKKDPRESHRE